MSRRDGKEICDENGENTDIPDILKPDTGFEAFVASSRERCMGSVADSLMHLDQEIKKTKNETKSHRQSFRKHI